MRVGCLNDLQEEGTLADHMSPLIYRRVCRMEVMHFIGEERGFGGVFTARYIGVCSVKTPQGSPAPTPTPTPAKPIKCS